MGLRKFFTKLWKRQGHIDVGRARLSSAGKSIVAASSDIDFAEFPMTYLKSGWTGVVFIGRRPADFLFGGSDPYVITLNCRAEGIGSTAEAAQLAALEELLPSLQERHNIFLAARKAIDRYIKQSAEHIECDKARIAELAGVIEGKP